MIPAGERWGVNALAAGTDSGLRPCVEDHLGAGAIVEALLALSCSASPEATLAATAFRGTEVTEALTGCVSGCPAVNSSTPDTPMTSHSPPPRTSARPPRSWNPLR